MAAVIDVEWIEARIAKTKTMIVAYEDAILALSTGSQTYMIDTGQTRQSVTKAHLATMESTLDALENRLAVLESRLRGGSVIMRPGF